MKKFIVKNKLYVFMFILFIIFGLASIIPLKRYEVIQEHLLYDYNNMVNECKNKKNEDMSEKELEICNFYLEVMKPEELNMTVYNGYNMFVSDFYGEYLSEFIIALIIIIGSTYYVTKYLRNRIIINSIFRESYKNIVKKLFFSSWKYACMFPMMLLIVFILTYILTGNGSNGYAYMEDTIFENNVLLYFIFIFIQSFILTLLYTNISLIVSRKEHNYILAVIKTLVCIIGLQLLFETLNNRIYMLFNGSLNFSLNIMNMYSIFNDENAVYNMICMIVLLAISFVILFISYKKPEKLIIDSEKNDNKSEE